MTSVSNTALFPRPSFSRALAPVQPLSRIRDDVSREPQQPPLQTPRIRMTRTGTLAGAAEILRQRALSNDEVSLQNLQAISAYRSLENAQEQDRVSSLLGVDEYA